MSNLPTTSAATFITRNNNYQSASVEFWALVDCKTTSVSYGDTLGDFFGTIIENHINNVYIHDFQYMSSYLLDYILKDGYVYNPKGTFNFDGDRSYNLFRDDTGHVYFIKIFYKTKTGLMTCEIKSSKNKTMSSVKSLYKSFGIKIDTDIDINSISDNTIQLNNSDVLNDLDCEKTIISAIIVASTIKKLKKAGYNKLTIGSDSLKQWIKLDGDKTNMLPRIKDDVDKDLRFAYRGGFTWCNKKFVNKVVDDGIVLDVNSLYPFVMREFPLPYGTPTWTNEYPNNDDYYVAHFVIDGTLKDGCIPCISNMYNSNPQSDSIISNEYLDNLDNFDCWLTNFDYELLCDMYNIKIKKYFGTYIFKKTDGLFDNFIDLHYEIKRTSTGATRTLSKLMLDSLYGRFGIKINKKSSLPVYSDNKLSFVDGDVLEDKTIRYLPIAIFITSIARFQIIHTALECIDRVIYIDTDSLHLVGTDIPACCNISDKLGDFKIESRFSKAKYVGLKTYIHDEITDDGIKTVAKMAGAPDTVKQHINWSNFQNGTKVPGKYYIKTVPGGYIRCMTTYTITQVC